jgi:hypothetical protein
VESALEQPEGGPGRHRRRGHQDATEKLLGQPELQPAPLRAGLARESAPGGDGSGGGGDGGAGSDDEVVDAEIVDEQ